jgi:threonine/homoserine/homoserine lactone efflux protein
MNQNNVSFKQGIPFYMGIASIATGLFLLSVYSVSSWYDTLAAIIAFIAAGLILYLGWLAEMGMDTQDSDNSNGGGGRIFLDKPA